MFGFIAVMAAYLCVFAAAEFFYKQSVDPLYTRKLAHIGGGAVSFFLPYAVSLRIAIGIGLFFTAVLFAAKRKKILKSVDHESARNYGACLFPFGLAVAAWFFWPVDPLFFQGAVLVQGLGDGLAGLVGQNKALKSYAITGRKTYRGSFVFFLVCGAVVFSVLACSGFGFTPATAVSVLIGCLAVTAVEGIFSRGWDNLAVPIATGGLLYLLL